MGTSGRWQLGFALALVTTTLWGAAPLAMTPLLAAMDPVTISWYRYAGAGCVLFVLLGARGRLRLPRGGGASAAVLFAIAAVTLSGNTVLYVSSLRYVAVPVAQVVVQLAPVLLMLGSMLVYRERFTAPQWMGFAVLVAGIAVFCIERLRAGGVALPRFGLGVGGVFLASVLWAIYGLAQKGLLRHGGSQTVLMGLYLASTVLMTPFATHAAVRSLSGLQLALLVYLGASTLLGYGAFAAALHHWESSKISAVLALQPLPALFGAHLLGRTWPEWYPPQPLGMVAVGAALVVVAGSLGCALGDRLTKRAPR